MWMRMLILPPTACRPCSRSKHLSAEFPTDQDGKSVEIAARTYTSVRDQESLVPAGPERQGSRHIFLADSRCDATLPWIVPL